MRPAAQIRYFIVACIVSRGERADPNTVQWAESVLKVPIIDHWWQRDGWCIAGNPSARRPAGQTWIGNRRMPGYDIAVVDEALNRRRAAYGLDRLKLLCHQALCRHSGSRTSV